MPATTPCTCAEVSEWPSPADRFINVRDLISVIAVLTWLGYDYEQRGVILQHVRKTGSAQCCPALHPVDVDAVERVITGGPPAEWTEDWDGHRYTTTALTEV